MKERIVQLLKEISDSNEIAEQKERACRDQLQRIHIYNDTKDAGQSLLGRLGQLEGKTLQELYNEYGLNQDD